MLNELPVQARKSVDWEILNICIVHFHEQTLYVF